MKSLRLMQKACLAAVTLALLGCASTDEPFTTQSGARGYYVYCGEYPYSDESDCAARAAELCSPGGYSVMKDQQLPYPHTETMWQLSTITLTVQCTGKGK